MSPRERLPPFPGLSDPTREVVVRGPGRDAALLMIGAVGAVGVLATAAVATPMGKIATLAGAAAVAVLVWTVFVRPALLVRTDELVVVGSVRTLRLAWARIDGFAEGLVLVVLVAGGRRVSVPAVPARLRDRARGRVTLPAQVALALTDRLASWHAGSDGTGASVGARSRPVWADPVLLAVGSAIPVILWLVMDR